MRMRPVAQQGGFTLIEVMLVIVIMAIMAGLIVMNVQGVEHRRILQAREVLLIDLQKIRLEAMDQGRILGLVALPATDVAPAGYQVVEYRRLQTNTASTVFMNDPNSTASRYQWQVAEDFSSQQLPEGSYLTIQMLDHGLNMDALKTQQNQTLPQLIWLGNGEVIPASLQLATQQQTIGEPIELNRLGLVVSNVS